MPMPTIFKSLAKFWFFGFLLFCLIFDILVFCYFLEYFFTKFDQFDQEMLSKLNNEFLEKVKKIQSELLENFEIEYF